MKQPSIAALYRVEQHEGAKFGLEVECEFSGRIPHFNAPYWKEVEDHSLRNGREWVSDPIDLKTAVLASQQLMRKMERCNGRVFSTRTSTHIHVNMSDLDSHKTGFFCLVFAALEDTLKKTLAPTRDFSNFCYPCLKTYGWLASVQKMFLSPGKAAILDPELRYAALNYMSLGKYGTVECRIFESPKDHEDLVKNVFILHQIRKYIVEKDLKDFQQVMAQCQGGDMTPLVEAVFSPKIRKLLLPHAKGHIGTARVIGKIVKFIVAKTAKK